MATENPIISSIENIAPPDLASSFVAELAEIQRRFHLGDWRPAQLSGARLCEAALRICEQVVLGRHTPIGTHLAVPHVANQLESATHGSFDETFRLHIPRVARAVYDLRNKRDVAHLGDGVNPNAADSLLVLTLSNWIAAEFVRVGHKVSLTEAQRIVDSLVERKVPLIYEAGTVVRVLDTTLRAKEKALVVLLHFQHIQVFIKDLAKWISYPNVSRFRSSVLRELHDEAYVHVDKDIVSLLPPGRVEAEKILKRRR